MQDLSHFNAAASVTSGMKAGPQFVRIMRGAKEGTVARVAQIRMKYYSAHEYKLSCDGRRDFWVKGEDLEYLTDYQGETKYVNDVDFTVTHNDMMGNELAVGQTIMFSRSATGSAELCIGTIKKINKSGAIYANIFKMSRSEEMPKGMVKVGVPSSAIIMDRSTVDNIVLAKMAAF